jgi:hypothetical protein
VPEKLSGRDVDFVREWRSRAGPSEDTDELIRRDRGPAVGGLRHLKPIDEPKSEGSPPPDLQ